MNSTYSEACRRGYPYIRGNPIDLGAYARTITKTDEPRALLANRFSAHESGYGLVIYVAWLPLPFKKNPNGGQWIIEERTEADPAAPFSEWCDVCGMEHGIEPRPCEA